MNMTHFIYFQKVLSDINKLKPSLSVVTGDFNTRSFPWWTNDINTSEGSKLFLLTSSNGFPQLLNETTDIQTSSSFCIDLVFTDQPNVSVISGVHIYFHPNSYHYCYTI